MTTDQVFFSIPLAGWKDERSWAVLSATLQSTLTSLLRQKDPGFEIVITGHERPDVEALRDPRVTFIEASFPKPADRSEHTPDRYRKRASNALHIREKGGGYVVLFDGDDLASSRLVKYIRKRAAPHGYTVRKGYALDHASGAIAPVPGAWKRRFNRLCGSCIVLRLAPEDIGTSLEDMAASYYGRFRPPHGSWEALAVEAGRPLQPIPFPAVIYVLNTSLNTSWMLTRNPAKRESASARILSHRIELTPALMEEFALARVLPPDLHPPPPPLAQRLGSWLDRQARKKLRRQ